MAHTALHLQQRALSTLSESEDSCKVQGARCPLFVDGEYDLLADLVTDGV